MMLAIPDLLDKEGVARVRAIIDAGDWQDGNATSGPQSALAKRNEQLPEDSAAARKAAGRGQSPEGGPSGRDLHGPSARSSRWAGRVIPFEVRPGDAPVLPTARRRRPCRGRHASCGYRQCTVGECSRESGKYYGIGGTMAWMLAELRPRSTGLRGDSPRRRRRTSSAVLVRSSTKPSML